MPKALQFPAAHPVGILLGPTMSCTAARHWLPFALLACTPRPNDVRVNVVPPEEGIGGREASAIDRSASDARPVESAASLGYGAPPGCPDAAHFLEQLTARTKVPLNLGPRGELDPSGPIIRVLIKERPPSEWTGSVLIPKDGGAVSREVSGASCDEVVVALALITSFWITEKADAQARADAQAQTDAQARPAPPDSPASDPAARAQPESAPLEGGPASPTDLEQRLPDGEHSMDYASHLLGTIGYAFSPAGAAKAGLRFELWGGESASTWAAGATVSYLSGRHTSARLGTSSLTSLLGQFDLCPPGIDFVGPPWLRACALLRAGALRFQAPTASLDDAQAVWRPWAATGIGLHGGVQLSSSYTLRVLSELSANLVRDAFDTERVVGSEPSVETSRLYRAGWLALDLAIGVSYDF